MVGDDEVDVAGRERGPQRLAVLGLADRRAALELGGAVGDVLGVEGQVVRAGLDAHVDPGRAGGAQRGDGVGAAQVHDVGPAAGGRGLLDDQARWPPSSAARGREARKPA